jgi:2-hydroxychromene-2-carboxylate isomerase
MTKIIEYYLAPSSPWTYLGHHRLVEIANKYRANVRLIPMDLGGKVFPATGGLPLGQRSPQRQAYRLVELRRFSEYLQIPINLQPKFFPVAADLAAKLIIVVQEKEAVSKAGIGRDSAQNVLLLTAELLSAVWAREENIADEGCLEKILKKLNLSQDYLNECNKDWVQQRYADNTEIAIKQGIFGAPSYVLEGEIFWGQDRLDFLESSLKLRV